MKKNREDITKYKILCTSHNSTNLINLCSLNGITLHNVTKTDTGSEFQISAKDYDVFRKLNTSPYTITISRTGGFKVIFNYLLFRIGLVIGIIVCLIGMFILNNRLLQVHVYGLTNIEKNEVVSELKSLGINRFTYMNFDTEKLESDLAEKFNFSLISIITKGNSLIINVKESLPSLEDSYVPITADYNMVIKSINVYSGTCMVKRGDIVYKGDVLVEPYIKSGENIVYVTPCAEIIANVYHSSSYKFLTTEEITTRTGKKQLISLTMSLGKWKLFSSDKKCKFDSFEMDESTSHISTYYLPINVTKQYAYELTTTTINRDFEKEKEDIINNVKKSAYEQISESLTVDEEEVNITPINGGYIINVYLMSVLTQVYEYHS